LAAFLSLMALGLGQVYNGELIKGLLMDIGLSLAALLYARRIFTDGSKDALFFWAAAATFGALEVSSIVQAYRSARRLGPDYTLRKTNRLLVYLLFPLFVLVLFIAPGRIVRARALTDISAWHPFRSARAKDLYLSAYAQRESLWPVPSEDRVVETSWGRTFVRISGPDDAPPLVLLHGASATSLMWAPNIEALSARYRTYAPDNICDLGRSAFTRRVRKPEDFVAWLDELFDALSLEDPIRLVGQSYGGWIAGQYLLRHPGRLRGVVLVAPAMTIVPFRLEFLGRGLLGVLPFRRFTASMMSWLLADLARTGEAGRSLIEDYVDNIHLGQRCFKPKSLIKPTLLTDRELKNIEVPTLFLVGENEKIYPPGKALTRLKSVAPRIRTEIVPRAGHDLTLAQADLVNRKILAFFAEIQR
jgi:pimeloyl-ACP methyl ester carboxylesterase